MSDTTNTDHTPDRRARARRVRRRVELERSNRATAGKARIRHGPGEPAARDRRRLRLPRRGPRADRRPRARRRSFMRRRGDHERGNRRTECRRPRLRGGVRTRRGRDPRCGRGGLEDSVLNSALVPRQYRPPPADRRRSSTSTQRRPATRAGRPLRRAGRANRSHPAARRRRGVRRARPARVEALRHGPSSPPPDKAAGTDVTRSMAERAGAKIRRSTAHT